MTEFFAMGGYAAYVWSAFGLTFTVMILNVISANHQYQKALHAIRRVHGGTSQ